MLSQALPDEIVQPQQHMPERSDRWQRPKSAYVKLLGNSSSNNPYNCQTNDDPFKLLKRAKYYDNDNARAHSSFKSRPSSSNRDYNEFFPDEIESVNRFEAASRSRGRERSKSRERERSQSRESNYYRSRPASPDENEDYYIASNYSNYNLPLPSAHELVSNRNTTARIKDLEKNNLHLKRMLQLVLNDPSRSIDRIKSAAPRLLVHRQNIKNSLGPPVQRNGRIGSSWRHIKQTNNYGNTNLLFIDGTVRINDSARYPSKIYGYPPRIANYDEDLVGMDRLEIDDSIIPISHNSRSIRSQTRQPNIALYSNQFSERARQGYRYWVKDERDPVNNKRKAKSYSTGARKTFFGLSDSILKT